MKKIITFFATVLITASALAEVQYYTDEYDCYYNCGYTNCLSRKDIIYSCPREVGMLSCADTLTDSLCASNPTCNSKIEESGTDATGEYIQTLDCKNISPCEYDWSGMGSSGVDHYVCPQQIDQFCSLSADQKANCEVEGKRYIKCYTNYYFDNGKCNKFECEKGFYFDTGSKKCVACGSYDGILLTSDGKGTDISSCYVDQDETYSDGRGTYTISGNNGKCHLNLTTAK